LLHGWQGKLPVWFLNSPDAQGVVVNWASLGENCVVLSITKPKLKLKAV